MRSNIAGLPMTLCAAAILWALPGCGSNAVEEKPDGAGDAPAALSADEPDTSSGKRSFAPLDLGPGSGRAEGSSTAHLSGPQRTQAVKQNLRPLMTLIGKWNGTIDKKAGVETVKWIYDVRTDETHPRLKMTTATGGYLKEGKLTWLPDEEQYQFTALKNDGAELEFVGSFSVEPHDVDGDNAKRPQRAYKLELKRKADDPEHKLAKIVINQRDNGRYLLELYDKRGRRFDTINTMREGRSFAVSEDYGEKECVISQGLGTIAIPYKGKTYWVCCSGCEAEFKAEPEKWIAKYESLKAAEE